MVLQQKQLESTNQQNNTNENDDAVVFKLKYLGSSIVEKVSGENISVEAVKGIIKFAKASRKIQSVNIAISLKGIAVLDLKGEELLNISIYRISNCSTDPSHRQVFSFVSTDAHETTECHAFLCTKRRTAETVTLAVAHAFSTAYEAWRILPSTVEVVEAVERRASLVEKNNQQNQARDAEILNNKSHQQQIDMLFEDEKENDKFVRKHLSVERLIDLGDDEDDADSTKLIPINTCDKDKWVSFEEDFMIQGFSALS